MGISGVCGGAEELEIFGKADTVTVTNKPHMAPSISSSSTSSSESVIDPVKMSYGMNGEEEGEFEWVAVDKEIDLITDEAPELDDAFSALQLMFNDDEEESGDQVSESEFVDWIEPPLQLCNTRLLQPYMLDRLYDAFHVFQTDPSVQRMVMSLTSDKAVWDAVMSNEVVRELISNAERSEEDSGSAANCLRRFFERSAVKIMDAMERVTKYVTDLFNVVPGDETVVLASGAAPVMEKLQMTVLLSIVVLLIVLVKRVTRGR
ncbi:unnamed protein product [Arabidopsis lyrata]|uniref:Transmembrane protein n=1 Tax=Arabidopsis lyrata subsp. lyrata TaxID=81972 RepID=D7MV25_ARALL|nr:uncharacterized protein LOC9302513 [Arabidopsis lyrata subsp. lyrata]EFH40993.1 hypothetical protein ARALYDRAFT_332390 [Arabidopsis lyrata subsp. lyrata]CAH8280449.1 unnamed protein product [Arabidopsis lyrata]|eukprot:XP_002864734.1 uncharacterized protein LOC9302513 [Arabidopsis lyrata subsp. lyrata]